MNKPNKAPYTRLSALYFCFFASMGIFFPYWGLYLQFRGFDSVEIGELMAILMGTALISPNVWGWLADHTGYRLRLIQIAGLLSIITFAGIFSGGEYGRVMLVMFLFGFFWQAALPQIEALTLSFLEKDTHRYGNIRLWGSLGFGVLSTATGYILDGRSMSILPMVMLSSLILIWVMMSVIPQYHTDHTDLPHESLLAKLRNPAVIMILLVSFLVFFSHGPFQTFSGIYFENAGYSRKFIGWIWAIGLASEVILLFWIPRLLQRFGLRRILLAGILVHIPGWLLIAWQVETLLLMLTGQVLVSIGFAACNATAIGLVHRYFTGRLQGRGQALFLSLSAGGGLMSGALVSGYIWEMTAPHTIFVLAAVVTAASGIIVYLFINK